jgi:LacI family transcriptional regulator
MGGNGSEDGLKHVAVTFHPQFRPWLRAVMTGVNRYQREHGSWRVTLSSHFSQIAEDPLSAVEQPLHGILGGAPPGQRERVLDTPQAKVLLGQQEMQLGLPWVGPDYVQVGRMGADYLRDRGYHSLCLFIDAGGERWTGQLREGFVDGAGPVRDGVRVFTRGPRTVRRGAWRYEDQIADLVDLIGSMPRPAGVLASDDVHAWRVLTAVRRLGLRCPEDVAVLGIGNDEFSCESAQPPLSSIALDYDQIGYLAARMLDSLMRGERVKTHQTVPPHQVVTRESTGHAVFDDPDLLAAMKYIHEHIGEPITVEDIADAVLVSSRTLLRKFKQHLGRSPSDQVRRLRVEHAKRLLVGTTKPLAEVAVDSGFGLQSALGRAIKKETGLTPSQLRRQYGLLV